MSDIESLFPILKGLHSDKVVQGTFTLAPGESVEVFSAIKAGWVKLFLFEANTPFANLNIRFQGRSFDFNHFTLSLLQGTVGQANHAVAYVSRTDVGNSIYSWTYAPRPYQYFILEDKFRISYPTINPLTGAPLVAPATIGGFEADIIYIEDLEEYRKSLKRIF